MPSSAAGHSGSALDRQTNKAKMVNSSKGSPSQDDRHDDDISPSLFPANSANTLLHDGRREWSAKRFEKGMMLEPPETPKPDIEHDPQKYAEILETLFPRVVPEEVLIDHVTRVLNKHGFTPKTAINLVSCCRDELCRPFTDELDSKWGHSFNISSLGGMVFCGRTGFKAAMAHSPTVEGKERYVFWVAPHIAVPMSGEEGTIYRDGREGISHACGALLALLGEIKRGKLNLQLDNDDLEQSLLKQHIVSHLAYGQVPSLVQLTYAAYECIRSEVHRVARASVNPSQCEYVVVAGIQVHGALGQNFFWPGSITKVVDGKSVDLYEEYAASVAVRALDEWTKNDALALLQFKEREARLSVQKGDLVKLRSSEIPLSTVRDNRKRTLLHIAALCGQNKVVELLIKRHPGLTAEKDINDRTALEYAVQAGNDVAASMIAEVGGGLTGEWLSAQLMAAVQDCECDRVTRLLDYADDPKAAVLIVDEDGRSLAQMVTDADRRKLGRARVLKILLSYGADLESGDYYGRNAVERAVAQGDQTLLQVMLPSLGDRQISFDGIGQQGVMGAVKEGGQVQAPGMGMSPPKKSDLEKMSVNEVLQSLSDEALSLLKGEGSPLTAAAVAQAAAQCPCCPAGSSPWKGPGAKGD